MKDRMLTFALAIGAFALFYVLLAPKSGVPQEQTTRPVSTEQGPNGYLALERWLTAGNVATVSMRERYGRLAQAAQDASAGNLLITTAPHLYPMRDSEAAPLHAWIAQGNTLLVVAGLSDTPDWSMGEGADPAFMTHMQALTGLTFTQARELPADAEGEAVENQAAAGEAVERDAPEGEAAADNAATAEGDAAEDEGAEPLTAAQAIAATQKLAEPQRFELQPNGAHPLLAGVETVAALSEYPTGKWYAAVTSDRLLLELARDPESDVPVLWLLRYGAGQIIVSAYGSIFTNKLIGEEDNAQLLANIVAWSVAPDGRVLIDDAHQGLVAFYDADAFFADQRLHASLWWLIGLWLVFVLGPQRLRVAAGRAAAVDVTTFVRATGGFMARVLQPGAAAQRLFSNFFDEIRRQSGLPVNGAPVWDWMSAHTSVSHADIAQLQELHARALRGRRLDLPKLQTLLAQTRNDLR